jgi:hypothetical protein
MARTADILGRVVVKTDQQPGLTLESLISGKSITSLHEETITLSTNVSNVSITFGSNFNTAMFMMIKAENGSITYSVNANDRHHPIAASATTPGVLVVTGTITSLYLTNNSTTDTPTLTVLLGGD